MSITVGVAPNVSGVGARLHQSVLREHPAFDVRVIRLPWINPGQSIEQAGWDQFLPSLDGLDLFVVGTPPYCQVQHAEALLQSGVPVLCEKPAGMDELQTRNITGIANYANLDCRVNYQLRFHPLVERARNLVRMGTPRSVHIRCTLDARRVRSGKPDWYWQPGVGGGVWFSLLSHLIDLAHFLGFEIIDPIVTSSYPSTGPWCGMDALTIRSSSHGIGLVITADALSDFTKLTVGIRTASGVTELDLSESNGATPWRTAFARCARCIAGQDRIDLTGARHSRMR